MASRRREVGLRYYYTYSEVEYNDDGWADPRWYKPLRCDLVNMKVLSSYDGKFKEFHGWWNGKVWVGCRLREEDHVLAWQLCEESDIGIDEKGRPVTTGRERKLKHLPRTEVKYED